MLQSLQGFYAQALNYIPISNIPELGFLSVILTADLVKIELKNVSAVSTPSLIGYGAMRDHCHDFTASFVGGKAYGLIGECGSGGWTFSHILAGCNKYGYEGQISFNGKIMSKVDLNELGWYIGEGINKNRWFTFRKPSIIKQLKSGQDDQIDRLIERFQLSPSRLDRNIEMISNERWNASAAIGLAHGKLVFGYPWLSPGLINTYLYERIKLINEILKETGATVLLPTSRIDVIQGLVDETIEIIHPDEKIIRNV
ncbi:hypothetical protein OB236_15525 [Paenibacillus sp. WQ 127069]|uniref:Uncharacterized protein n=1 Tax=Paenibacillus baimaensis TaxID=2982185 RepID=A0ABT2UFV6_9BACL|nr:hypothetical protein [Paenibacillus sp. WQ 127069]